MSKNYVVYADLLAEAALSRKQNALRYMIAARFLDDNGQGWCEVPDLVEYCSILFGVKEKTALNNLYMAQNLGFGQFTSDGNRFFYFSQESVLSALGRTLSSRRAVEVSLKDISGDIVEFRAFVDQSPLAWNNTMSRKTRKKLTRSAPKTQRKYERRRGVVAQRNCAILGLYSDYPTTGRSGFWLNENRDWGTWDTLFTILGKDGRHYVARALPNTYDPKMIKSRRRGKTKVAYKKGRLEGTFDSLQTPTLFFADRTEAYRYWLDYGLHQDVYYKVRGIYLQLPRSQSASYWGLAHNQELEAKCQ